MRKYIMGDEMFLRWYGAILHHDYCEERPFHEHKLKKTANSKAK